MKAITLTALAATAAFIAAPTPSIAEVRAVVGTVNAVLLSSDDLYGGCMAALSADPQAVLPGCGAGWVTFSCTGDFTDQVRAYRMVDQAQLAYATNRRLRVFVDDTKKHNGYCFTPRVDVIR